MLTEEEIKAIQEENAALKASVGSLTTETESMRSKMDQLLTETKSAKSEAKKAAEEAQRIAEEKALKDGNFEELHKASEAAREALQQEHSQLLDRIATNERNGLANKIAGQLAEGDNAELLSSFIAPRLKSTEDGIKILDNNGGLTVLTPDDLATEFKGNARYSALLKGNQSSGGGAAGGQSSGGAAQKTMNRDQFDQLNPAQRMDFVKGGGVTTDE